MRKWMVIGAAAALAPASALAADDAASVKKTIEAQHVAAMKAFEKKDLKVMMSFVADDYSATDMTTGQKQNKAAAEKEMAGYMKDTKKVNASKYTVSDVKVNGDKATGKTSFMLDAVVVDSTGMLGGKKGATYRMKMEQEYKSSWRKSGSKWLVTNETPLGAPKMEMDGKPFNPSAPPAPKKK